MSFCFPRLLFVVVWALFSFQACTPASTASPAVGERAPAFEALCVEGKALRFPEDTAQKVVLIRFWAERCAHCELEMRELEEVFQQLQGEGFVILAIHAGQSPSSAAAFARKLRLSYSMLLDKDNPIAKRYGVRGVPTSFLVDRQGFVRAKFVGQTPKAVFEQSAKALLGD